MPSNEQRRQAAKRKLERQLARRAERVKRRRNIAVITTAVVVVLAVGGVYFLTTQVGGKSDPTAQAAPSTTPSAPAAQTTKGACQFSTTPGQPASKPVSMPDDPQTTPSQGTVRYTLATSQGTIPVTLNRAEAPCTVLSFDHLVQAKYFDNTPCHRLTTGDGLKVLQCGDPSGTGSGGPGYSFRDELPKNLKPAPSSSPDQPTDIYPRGTLAMANSGPNTNGSQFFMVYADSTLPPNYTVFGTIDPAGLAVLDKIAAAGVAPGTDPQTGQPTTDDGKPKLPVTIQQAAPVV